MLESPTTRVLLLSAACLLAVFPWLWWGAPSGHDFEFHLSSWMEVHNQWCQGILYPHWAAGAHSGYGEARFVFYPPASWTLGAALGTLLPWRFVPAVYCWLALLLAALSMDRLTRTYLPGSSALFAALFYALNPYHLLIVYWRSAYAELLAAAIIPAVLLCLLRLHEPGSRWTLYLAALLAAAWLTNGPAALMIEYSTAGLAAMLAFRRFLHKKQFDRECWRTLGRTAAAALLGAGLAAFYLVPAVYEQRWVNIGEVLSAGVRPQDNFLFTTLADPDHNRFNRLVSILALSEIAALLAAAWWLKTQRADSEILRFDSPSPVHLLQWMSAALALGSAFLMVRVSDPLWRMLPKLQFVQLPFRWLLCFNTGLALLLTCATRSWVRRSVTAALLFGTVLAAGRLTQPPWWAQPADIRDMQNSISEDLGYEGTDEYVPAGVDPYDVNKNLPFVSTPAGEPIHIQQLKRGAESIRFRSHADSPRQIVVRLFDYPAWQVTVNGHHADRDKTENVGLMLISLPAGDDEVLIHFAGTGDSQLGDATSILSCLIFGIVWFKTKPPRHNHSTSLMKNRTVLVATSNAGKLRDFSGAAIPFGITIAGIPGFPSLPPVVEDGTTFEANARKKAEEYSRAVPGELVLADDSGLEVDALGGRPGVHSARYAADEPHAAEANTDDAANNTRVLRAMTGVPASQRTARFVCVLAAARDGKTLATFRGAAEGIILDTPRGHHGFGYDPLFYFPQIGKTFAELAAEEKARYSHRGAAFRAFLEWYSVS